MRKVVTMISVLLLTCATIAAQCTGITKKGTQCKRQAATGSDYCWQHRGTTATQRTAGITAEEGRCKAITKAGTQCKRNAQTGSKFCWQHQTANTESQSDDAHPQEKKTTTNQPNATDGVCTATTKNGTRCKRKAQPGTDRCWQHIM